MSLDPLSRALMEEAKSQEGEGPEGESLMTSEVTRGLEKLTLSPQNSVEKVEEWRDLWKTIVTGWYHVLFLKHIDPNFRYNIEKIDKRIKQTLKF